MSVAGAALWRRRPTRRGRWRSAAGRGPGV